MRVCDCFLEIACHCLNMSANSGQFKRMCLMHFDKKNGSNSLFVIMNASGQFMHQSLFHVTCMACCKDFVDFQINFFNETSFQLRSIDYENTNDQQEDIEFDCQEIFYLAHDHDIDSGLFDSDDDHNIELNL